MIVAHIDFETFNDRDLRKTGVQTSDLHSAKAKQINAIQTPTPNAERHSARATKESN